jgi:cytidylate kinase
MPLIAMTREMGSLGKDVAQGVAEALGLEVVHHEIIDHVADKMRLRKSHVVRLLDGKATILERLTADRTSLAIFTADETYGIAHRNGGAVIRGWGATHLLRQVGHAVCVRVCAPRELRVRRMMERLHTDDEDFVRKEVNLSDEAHAAIMRRHFAVNWQDGDQYDVSLNTERVPIGECVEKVLKLVRGAAFAETRESHATLENLSLSATVRAALRNDPRTRKASVTIACDRGRVTLSGIVEGDTDPTALGEVAGTVPGIKDVENRVKSTTPPRFRGEY